MREVTSINLEVWIKKELSDLDVNTSDLVNTFLESWLISLKQKGNILKRSIQKTILTTELKKELETLILNIGEEK